MNDKPKKQKQELAPYYIGHIEKCDRTQGTLVNALDFGGKPFKVRLMKLNDEEYNIALHCLYYKIPVVFFGIPYWKNENTTGYYRIDMVTVFKPTEEIDLSEKIDEKLANPKPKKKKGIKLNPRQWKTIMDDGITEIEEETSRLRKTFTNFLNNDCCQDIQGQNNNGRWLRGQMLSLFYRVQNIKDIFEAYFENRLVEINAMETEEKAIKYAKEHKDK